MNIDLSTNQDEIELLQSRLSDEADVPRERNDNERDPSTTPTKLASPKGLSYTQWQLEANDRFTPCGESVRKLPASIYEPQIDSEGVLHLKQTPPLTDKLIELKDSKGEVVITNIRKFWTRRDRYKKRGILFKRGVLLWGSPGSGKTAIIQFLMRDLIAADGIVILGHSPAIINQALKDLRRIEPERPLIVVLEDIDEIMEQYSEHELLALLDGEHHIENVVNIATTNYPERLGARIINRPSRFDEVHFVDMPSDQSREQYLKHVLGDDVTNLPELGKIIKDTHKLTLAHIRELVVASTCLDQPYEETIIRLKGMKKKPKSSMAEGTNTGFKKDMDED